MLQPFFSNINNLRCLIQVVFFILPRKEPDTSMSMILSETNLMRTKLDGISGDHFKLN